MKVRLKRHKIVLNVKSINEKTKEITVKMFGTLCKFREDEYTVVDSEK